MRRLFGTLLTVLLLLSSYVSVSNAASSRTLWDEFPKLKSIIELDGKTQYLLAYDPEIGETTYGDLSLATGLITGQVKIPSSDTLKTVLDYSRLPAPLAKAAKPDGVTTQDYVDPGTGGGCTQPSYNRNQTLTKGRDDVASSYWYSMTMFWTYSCPAGEVTSYSVSVSAQSTCYTATKSKDYGRVSTSQVWGQGDYSFVWSCGGSIFQKDRWIHANAYGNGTISWTWAAP